MSGEMEALASRLSLLRTQAPSGLIERVAARWTRVDGPAGEVFVASTDAGIAYLRTGAAVHHDAVEFTESARARLGRPLLAADRPPAGLRTALRTGKPGDLRFDLRRLSGFERAVLEVTQHIPRGQVRPYSWVAQQIGQAKAVRAVGSALGKNPVPLLIPCHRIIRSDGSIGEYVFGPGLKETLLRAEGANVDEVRRLGLARMHYLGSDTTHIYCFPSCPNARRISQEHRRGFATADKAQRAGYRPCRHCRPVEAVHQTPGNR